MKQKKSFKNSVLHTDNHLINNTPLMCQFSLHKWELTFDKNPRQERTCKRCGKTESTMYDMSYGWTYWTNGKWWSKKT